MAENRILATKHAGGFKYAILTHGYTKHCISACNEEMAGSESQQYAPRVCDRWPIKPQQMPNRTKEDGISWLHGASITAWQGIYRCKRGLCRSFSLPSHPFDGRKSPDRSPEHDSRRELFFQKSNDISEPPCQPRQLTTTHWACKQNKPPVQPSGFRTPPTACLQAMITNLEYICLAVLSIMNIR